MKKISMRVATRLLLLFFVVLVSLPVRANALTDSELPKDWPRISNPTLTLSLENRLAEVTFSHSGVAGDLADARFTLVIAVFMSPTETKLNPIWDNSVVLRESAGEGRYRVVFSIPDDVAINEEKDVTGFGFVFYDAEDRQAPAVFLELELDIK
jgi:hypothetical protein